MTVSVVPRCQSAFFRCVRGRTAREQGTHGSGGITVLRMSSQIVRLVQRAETTMHGRIENLG
jgi:hypothetical protein